MRVREIIWVLLIAWTCGFASRAAADISPETQAVIARSNQLQSRGEFRQAADVLRIAYDDAREKGAPDDDLAKLAADLGFALSGLEEWKELRALQEGAIIEFQTRGFAEGQLAFITALADTLYWTDEIELAEQLNASGAALAEREKLLATATYAELLVQKAVIQYERNDLSRAIATIDQALEIGAQIEGIATESWTHVLIWASRLYRHLALGQSEPDAVRANMEISVDYARRAAEAFKADAEASRADYAITLESLSRTEFKLGLKEEAVAHLEEAVLIMRDLGLDQGRDYILMTGYLSFYLTGLDRNEDARFWANVSSETAGRLYMSRFQSAGGPQEKDAGYLRFSTIALFEALLKAEGNVGEEESDVLNALRERTFAAASLNALSPLVQAMRASSREVSQNSPHIREVLQEVERLRADWNEADAKLAAVISGGHPDADYLRELNERKSSLEAAISLQHDKVSKIDSGFAALWEGESASIRELQSVLRDDEAYILPSTGFGNVFVFVVTRDEVRFYLSEFEDGELCREVSTLRNALSRQSQMECDSKSARIVTGHWPEGRLDLEQSHALYARLFGPAEDLLSQKRSWIISMPRALAPLPIGALVVAPPERKLMKPSGTAWLGREKALMLAPSASALYALRRSASSLHAASETDHKLMLAGSPCTGAYAGEDCDSRIRDDARSARVLELAMVNDESRGAGAILRDGGEIADLEELPGAYRELQAAGARVGEVASEFVGSGFSEKVFRDAQWPESGTLLIATHALAADELYLDQPALVMSPSDESEVAAGFDGILTAGEIGQMHMPLDWVILSGCSTAAPGGSSRGEMFSGLALGFIQAGARSLLVSYFEVQDGAAAHVTPRVLAEYYAAPEAGRAEALRAAIDSLLSDPAASRFHHPSQWAPFAVLGVDP